MPFDHCTVIHRESRGSYVAVHYRICFELSFAGYIHIALDFSVYFGNAGGKIADKDGVASYFDVTLKVHVALYLRYGHVGVAADNIADYSAIQIDILSGLNV